MNSCEVVDKVRSSAQLLELHREISQRILPHGAPATCPSLSPTFTLHEAGAEVTASVADAMSGPAAASVSADAETSSVLGAPSADL